MDTKTLERFAQAARRQLHDQVAAKLALVLTADSGELRGRAEALRRLQSEIRQSSRAAVVERVAYTWFNRFCALRFMDANGYTRVPAVSPYPNATQPGLLQEAKAGEIDGDLLPFVDREQVLGLLQGRIPSRDAQQEVYRLLLVGVCNQYHAVMPFLFEPIADYTELLMPDDLLSANSVLHAMREALTPEACQDVEVIGWLYQFYIAEKKEAVDAKVKAGGSVEADELPAKTSLYTPHWIVRFLVENSLGRLWLLNRPHSKLAERMDYYIAPETPEADFVRVASPEELRICDPACGSGHMLTYAFDLLYAIYAEEGYPAVEIPRLILQKNLVGMEIDARAGALAAFALVMKGRGQDKRFLRRGVKPAICVYTPLQVGEAEIRTAPWLRGLEDNLLDLPPADALLADLARLSDIGLVGSLLRPRLSLAQIETLQAAIGAADDLFSHDLNERVQAALAQLAYLAQQYHVVVANPPYLGSAINADLKAFAQEQYPDSKTDCFAMFIERNLDLAVADGSVGMITMQSWMFLSSFEKLRCKLLDQETILVMAHLGTRAFDSISGGVVSTTAFVLSNAPYANYRGDYLRLVDGRNEAEKDRALRTGIPTAGMPLPTGFHYASAADFKKIPGAPVAYWISSKIRTVFEQYPPIGQVSSIRAGMATGDNGRHVRIWHEVVQPKLMLNAASAEDVWTKPEYKWVPFNKGGVIRKWYGNNSFVLNYDRSSYDILKTSGNHCPSEEYYFRECLTWSDVTDGNFCIRYFPRGAVFSTVGNSIFAETVSLPLLCCALASNVVSDWLRIINPSLHANPGDVAKVPFARGVCEQDAYRVFETATAMSRYDWDSYETSWDFADLPLLRGEFRRPTLAASYAALRGHWQAMTLEMQRLEKENNRHFIDAYGLQDELTPDVPLAEITLTCNPHYRYGGGKTEAELEALLCADTMRELLSYAVGCMFGRYSLDKSGLLLANQGETVDDYLRQAPHPTFPPDKDNVIPILDGDWFPDDIVARFRRFLRVTLGEAHFAQNLAFIEQALGRDLRSYFVREFYDDHVKRYQKRPIYWLFSSPKGSFNALVYMHRYRPDTVSVVLNEYLREFRAKLGARHSYLAQVSINASASAKEKSAALKEMAKLDKVLAELTEYEDEVLYPLATQQIAIDLDDGVKVNYAKFGPALKRIAGVSG